MFSLNNINISFGGIRLLTDISFVINKKARIGLTGKNGAGKSTLMKIITGLQEFDSGIVSIPKDTTIGYLPQQMLYPEGKTVFNEAASVFKDITAIPEKIDKLNIELLQMLILKEMLQNSAEVGECELNLQKYYFRNRTYCY